MDQLQRNILAYLVKRKNDPSVNLTNVWRECGSVSPTEFVDAWNQLRSSGFVDGELDRYNAVPNSSESVQKGGAGGDTVKKPFQVEFPTGDEILALTEHGGATSGQRPVTGFGKITPSGEEEQKKPFRASYSSSAELLRLTSTERLDGMLLDSIHQLQDMDDSGFHETARALHVLLERIKRLEKTLSELNHSD
jgi:hypothetical protein